MGRNAVNNESLGSERGRRNDATWRQGVLDDTNRRYAELRSDESAWAEELAERALWDTSLQDGLTDCR